MPIRCDIVSRDRIVFSGDADLILLPGVEGVMGVLPDHSNLLTVLQFGVITVRTARDEQYFTVAGGVAEIQPDHVTVMADAAENVLEIDIERAEAAKKRAEETLAQGLPADSDVYLTQMAALRRSTMRLDAARRYKSRKSRQD